MPIYEFRCGRCDVKFEKLCSISAKSSVCCPTCGDKAESLFSMFVTNAGSSGGHSHSCGCDSSCSGGNCSNCHH